MRKQLIATLFILAGGLAHASTDTMEDRVARKFAEELVAVVELGALRPRDQQEYVAAKVAFLATIGREGTQRQAFYDAARRMLNTLDTDGHTILWTRDQLAQWQKSTSPSQVTAAKSVAIDRSGGAPVLVIRPPQATFTDFAPMREYAESLRLRVIEAITKHAPCALLIDLTDQKGGNAWPVLAVLGDLLTAGNSARLVDRDGKRSLAYLPSAYPSLVQLFEGLPVSGLKQFADQPTAVLIDSKTASAGEMIAVILKGEPKTRSFGERSYGATTANYMVTLPDDATLLLTHARYAIGDGEPIRGKLEPDVYAALGKAKPQALRWLAASTSQCDRSPHARQ